MDHRRGGRDIEVEMIEAKIVGKKLSEKPPVQLAREGRLREDVDFACEISHFDGAEQMRALGKEPASQIETDYQAIDVELNIGRRIGRGEVEVANRYFAEKRSLD